MKLSPMISFLGDTRGKKVYFSSIMLQTPMQMADFTPRNGREVEEKRRRSTQLYAFLLLSRVPKGPGGMGYKLTALACAGDQAGTRWPLYVLTKNITYNKLYSYFSLEYQGWGTEPRPVFHISHSNTTGKWEHQIFSRTYGDFLPDMEVGTTKHLTVPVQFLGSITSSFPLFISTVHCTYKTEGLVRYQGRIEGSFLLKVK